jgi:hypothetical protein
MCRTPDIAGESLNKYLAQKRPTWCDVRIRAKDLVPQSIHIWPADGLVGDATALAVDKLKVCNLLCSNLRERKVRRNVGIEATPLSWSRDFPLTFLSAGPLTVVPSKYAW